MRFEPRAPDDRVNVSPVHPLREATVLVVGVVAVFLVVLVVAAFGVDLALRFVTPELEMQLFGNLPLGPFLELSPEEPGELAEARRILDRLSEEWPDCPYRFRLGLLSSEEINALAVPGGLVVVTSGLLDAVESENELALVLGHELGHFRHRDHLRSLGRGFVYGLALSALLGRSSGPTSDLASLGSEIAARGFDRHQESQADLFGLELVVQVYGHAGGALDFFERLEGEPSVSRLGAYLSTHPHHAERQEELRAFARDRGWPLEGKPIPLQRAES